MENFPKVNNHHIGWPFSESQEIYVIRFIVPSEKNHILDGNSGKISKHFYKNMILCLIGGIFSSGMAGNKRIGRNFFKQLINVWYGIRACWVENFMKINKRTPRLIR